MQPLEQAVQVFPIRVWFRGWGGLTGTTHIIADDLVAIGEGCALLIPDPPVEAAGMDQHERLTFAYHFVVQLRLGNSPAAGHSIPPSLLNSFYAHSERGAIFGGVRGKFLLRHYLHVTPRFAVPSIGRIAKVAGVAAFPHSRLVMFSLVVVTSWSCFFHSHDHEKMSKF